MPEILPSPDFVANIDRPFNERSMVMQAWGAYGTLWPVVHQWLGVSPDMGRGRLAVVPQLPPDQASGLGVAPIRVGSGRIDVAARRTAPSAGDTRYTTVVTRHRRAALTIGAVLPAGSRVARATVDGHRVGCPAGPDQPRAGGHRSACAPAGARPPSSSRPADGAMKKLINDPRQVVRESLEGLVLSQSGTGLLGDDLTVVRTDRVVDDANRGRLPVAVVSGGGAGHEPAHAGYVAAGMLTAAVSGDIFSSPSVDAVLAGIRAVTGEAGCLLVVKSYTGDQLNFGLAAELARAAGLAVEMVVVGDDVAIEASDANAGRRGLAGTVLVHKVAGAAAEAGRPLAEVAALARRVADTVGTMGVGLSAVTLPAVGEPSFVLKPDEIELGLGIHGEPGVSREQHRPADDLVADLVDRICTDRGLARGSRALALVGSAGATRRESWPSPAARSPPSWPAAGSSWSGSGRGW